MKPVLPAALAVAASLVAWPGAWERAHAFDLLPLPPGNRMVMNLNLPTAPMTTLGYGVQSWRSIAEAALARWNAVGVGIGQDHDFYSVRVPTTAGNPCLQDGVNEVRFSTAVCGVGWGASLGVTMFRSIGGVVVETDVLFNPAPPLNAYAGPTVPAGTGGPLIDFYRLALHEFGHAAGLGHPNQVGQTVDAVMNQSNQAVNGPQSHIDDLQADDIAGIHAVAFGGTLAAAILPASRSVVVGATATAFVSVINVSGFTALNVGVGLGSGAPAGLTVRYQQTNPATNQVVGAPNTPVGIPPGSIRTFVVALTPSAPFAPTEIAFVFAGSNTLPLGSLVGLNTLLLSASSGPSADVVALGATPGNSGIVDLPGPTGSGAFSMATVNVGSAGGPMTVSGDTGSTSLPVSIHVCRTDPFTGICLAPPGAQVGATIEVGETPTFAFFVNSLGSTRPFNPATDRVFGRIRNAAGEVVGATSIALRWLP